MYTSSSKSFTGALSKICRSPNFGENATVDVAIWRIILFIPTLCFLPQNQLQYWMKQSQNSVVVPVKFPWLGVQSHELLFKA